MSRIFFILMVTGFLLIDIQAQDHFLPTTLSERQQAEVVDEILTDRLDNLLPAMMRREGIQMWVIISREYNEDPVMKTMLPATWLSARRRTIMVFYDPGPGKEFEKIAIARYDVGTLLKGAWNIDVYPDQWEALIHIIKERNPRNIGINTSEFFGLADGLVQTEYKTFMSYLPQDFKSKVVSAERLAISWLETRSSKEMDLYQMIAKLSHDILQEGLS